MTTTSIFRRAAIASGLVLGAAGLMLGQASAASAVEYVDQGDAGTIEFPDGMVIGSDVLTGGEFVPRIQAGPLMIGASPASTAAQRVEARASLQRYDESIHSWRSTGQSGTDKAWILQSSSRGLLGDGSNAVDWTFTTSQDEAALYRVSYSIIWFVHDADSDPANDVVLGQAIVRPSEGSENVCKTTAFANWPVVSYEVPCTVTAQGIVI